MAVSRKGRRKIAVEGVEYVWWIAPADYFGGNALNIVGETNHLHLVYQLGGSVLSVLGRRFRGHELTSGCHRHFRCPPVGSPDEIAPGDVAALIRWAIAPGLLPPEVHWSDGQLS
jgi:hypothetical protein